MDNIFVIAGIIASLFTLVKFIEMRYMENESKPLKILIRDALLVYFSVVAGYFLIEQMNTMGGVSSISQSTPIFTGNPEF
jgi:hypothetical protein